MSMTAPPQIAVVGSGPSGCYLTQALLKAHPDLEVTVFERLPVPFGLVRYGVAADHQGTKAVTRQFERVFDSDRVRFCGNVEIGVDVSLDLLLTAYDAVVLATGLHDDRQLAIPGGALPGVHGAGTVTRALNAHPDATAPTLGRSVAVIGAGNVAVDVVRLLTKSAAHFEGSDLDDDAHVALTGRLETISLIARSSASAAKFDRAMILELAAIDGVEIVVHGVGHDDDPKTEAVREIATGPLPESRVRVELRFSALPLEVLGDNHVEALRVRDEQGERLLPVDALVTCIGFAGVTLDERGVGARPERVHRVGWARRGPVGTIPANRADAREVAALVLDALGDDIGRPGYDALATALGDRPVDITHWRGIDERERATPGSGRVRRKLKTWQDLLARPGDDNGDGTETAPVHDTKVVR